jgi:hypothetical protein
LFRSVDEGSFLRHAACPDGYKELISASPSVDNDLDSAAEGDHSCAEATEYRPGFPEGMPWAKSGMTVGPFTTRSEALLHVHLPHHHAAGPEPGHGIRCRYRQQSTTPGASMAMELWMACGEGGYSAEASKPVDLRHK